MIDYIRNNGVAVDEDEKSKKMLELELKHWNVVDPKI